ncbi:MAG: domain containing protein [Firmicutes bacterium]|nr:domain containing protein [Bacillota bacterium]
MAIVNKIVQYPGVDERSFRTEKKGEIITLFSTVDAIGKSTIAVNLATCLARLSGEKVCIVDADLHFGDICRLLNIHPRNTIADFAERGYSAGEAIVEYLEKWQHDIFVLAAPREYAKVELVTAAVFGSVLSELSCHFKYILIDTSLGFSDLVLSALDMSNMILFINTLDSISGVKNLQKGLDAFQGIGYSKDKVKLILNRYKAKTAIGISEVESGIGRRFAAKVSNDFAVAVAATREGRPFSIAHPDKEISRDMLVITQAILSGNLGEEKTSLTERLNRWLGNK